MKTSVRTLNQNSKQLAFSEGLLCVKKGVACQRHRNETQPLAQSLKPFPFPLRGNRPIVVADVEERAVLPVDAELEGRGAGKEENGAVRVPSSDGNAVRKHR